MSPTAPTFAVFVFASLILANTPGPGGSPLAQSLLLSGVFISIAVCTDSIYVLTAAVLGPKSTSFIAGRLRGVRRPAHGAVAVFRSAGACRDGPCNK